jgi:TonB-dependent SusC/RagA subfamily outer membrane receptor
VQIDYLVVDSSILEAPMLSSSQEFSGRALPALTLLAGLLVGLVSGCAQKTATNEAESQVAPQEEPTARPTSSQEVQKRPREHLQTLLQGRTSGVIASINPDGSISVRIRGASSFYGSGEPLYVLDGVPIRVEPGGTIGGISPYEIESIRVLKGPPETTIYGIRGANGVIIIKTRNAG